MTKTILAVSIIGLLLISSTMVIPGVSAVGPPYGWEAHPPHHVKGAATSGPTGLSPSQIYPAYGINSLSCTLTTTLDWTDPQLCGHGQTIAIVDAYDDPTIANDLATFSTQFGLPACTVANSCFVKATPSGLPNSNSGWALEMALDVEWAHAIAPGAKIVLVEAKSNSFNDLFSAINYATSQTGANQVSMSWGGSEFSGETTTDSYFNKPGISFFASSGDSGAGTIYPSTSPYVVAVGGTTLSFTNGISETAWSGSGGGISSYESKPQYQTNYQISSSGRAVPDVSYDADPNSGVSVYDSTSYFGQTGWFVIGGTSVGAPQWAAISAIINSGGGQLSSASYGTNTALYNAATGTAYSANYRDITSGSNGNCSICNAGPGYDFVTGVGSPLTNSLIPYLQPSPNPDFAMSSSPSSLTINSGSSGSSTITVTSLNGFAGDVSLSSSAGSTLGASPLTVSSGGTASTTLTITNPASSGTYTVTGTSGSLTHSTTVTVTVPTVSSAPQNLVATAGNTQVTLKWNAPSSNGGSTITGYNVYRGTSAGGEDVIPITTVTGTSYTDSGLSNGQIYYYYVTATNSVGQSSPSNEVSATPQPTPTLSVSVTTDKPSYLRNSFAYITVTVTSSGPVSSSSVTITVKDPNNAQSSGSGTTNSNGQVVFKYRINPNAALGAYQATSQASLAGYISGSGSTTFKVALT